MQIIIYEVINIKMKALVYRADHSIALENVVKPVIQKPTDAIVRVTNNYLWYRLRNF